MRRPTPDSAVLASSDDHGDHVPLAQAITVPKPKRASWLNDVSLAAQLEHTLPGGPLLSGPSNPTSLPSDQGPWATHTSPGTSGLSNWNQFGESSFPWGTRIWNTESRMEPPPPHLSEIVPSPVPSPTMTESATRRRRGGDEMLSPTTRTTSLEPAIPRSIPLRPTPKTYHSQSYTVGQMDPEFLEVIANQSGTRAPCPRGCSRGPGPMSAVQPRASWPSVLGGQSHDSAVVGRVREDDGGGESLKDSDGNLNYSASQAQTIEQLARENALLRRAAAGQMDNRFRDKASSSTSVAGGNHPFHRVRGSVPEVDLSVEDLEELHRVQGYSNIRSTSRRRFSEHSPNLEQQFSSLASPRENRALDNVRQSHRQTSLGFGCVADIPQSRRHSLADIRIRRTSVNSIDSLATTTHRAELGKRDDGYGNMNDFSNLSMQPQSFYSPGQTLRGDSSSCILASFNQYAMSVAYGRQLPALSHDHQNQLLYIVTFKCHRADVFYIQKDTSLQVKTGDLVIVEADRGTDVGTVQHANVSLQEARKLKKRYAERNYERLMMPSGQGQLKAFNVANAGLNSRSSTCRMWPNTDGVQETTAGIQPKPIKRLAQKDEILTLCEKERNEAKAKHVCEQKVAEHRLNMEILEAEFQTDWKKLTFYYFADSYINFNSLVADLFKIYKTRIWMSAINPAAFVTLPTTGAVRTQRD